MDLWKLKLKKKTREKERKKKSPDKHKNKLSVYRIRSTNVNKSKRKKEKTLPISISLCVALFELAIFKGAMEIPLLKALLRNISSFLLLSKDDTSSDLVQNYYKKAEEILKLSKPVLDAIVESDIASNEVLNEKSEEMGQTVDDVRELFESWQPLSSKISFVLQVETSLQRIRSLVLDVFQLLKSSQQQLPEELDLPSLEKIKQVECEQTSSIVKEAIRHQVDGEGGPNSQTLVKISDSLSLKSNEEILIEAVALEKLKENAEQAEKIEEAEFFDQIIALVTHMHDRLVLIKQSETSSPVPIPPDFCCPLSLSLMTDPVIVASGQTYERAYIKKWIEVGLTVCPKTRQTLAHTNLIPNYTVKALIANWCESNNVKLPDATKSANFNVPSPLLHAESGAPRDSHVSPQSRGNQLMSPDSFRSSSSPSGIQREGTSPVHPRSTTEGSLSGIGGNGRGMDILRVSQTTSEGLYDSTDEKSVDYFSHSSVSPSRREASHAVRANELPAQSHFRSASASSTLDANNSQVVDNSESSEELNHIATYNSDTSGEVKLEQQASTALNSPRREQEFAPRFMETRSRNQTMWRRPDRLVPRVVSSPPIEMRADLAAIEAQVRKLVEDLKSTSVETQKNATSEIRLLAKHNMDNRIVIANCGAITVLVDLLQSTDEKIQENAVTALLNLSINDNNKTAIATAGAIEPLINVLKNGSPEAKENSAATLFSLSVIEDNKLRIGRSDAIGPLVDLLGNGTLRGKKDAATALFNLSISHENKARIVQAGAVRHLVELMDPAAGMVDKAVAVLANLATIPEGRAAIGQEGGIPVLVEVIELGSARGKENAAAALLQLCTNSNRFCNIVLQEGAVPPLVALSQSGTPRAKEKAQQLLSHFRSQRHGNTVRG